MKYCYPILFFFFFVSCSSPFREKLEFAFRLAGENRAELEKVLAYYQTDSLKQKAACFLIENMVGKGTISYQFLPPTDNLASWIRAVSTVIKRWILSLKRVFSGKKPKYLICGK